MPSGIVIGLGETGQPLYEILKEAYPNTDGYEMGHFVPDRTTDFYEVMNICFGYSDDFVNIVKEYQDKFKPQTTIIHSTVPIGTTKQIDYAVHSPILGDHRTMSKSLMTFVKWCGGSRADIASDYFSGTGMKTKITSNSDTTEALKLLCLAKYGMSIAFAGFTNEVANMVGFSYDEALMWDINYNDGICKTGRPQLRRPIIRKPDKVIGGHCILPNVKILNKAFPNSILEEILKYE